MKKAKKVITIICIALLGILATIILWILFSAFVIGLFAYGFETATPYVTTDISAYEDVIGTVAAAEYKNKLDMDESIFPESITENMNVTAFKMVYYNPFDPQYLSYLVVDYDEESYTNEMIRLKMLGIEEYKGMYEVAGFSGPYEIVAMNADEMYGFIYALTDNDDTIIYVELLNCNYFMDLDYTDYIEQTYLPDGYNALPDNPYRKAKMAEMGFPE